MSDSGSLSVTGQTPINHGTPGGYSAHHRRGEKACRACVDARTNYRAGPGGNGQRIRGRAEQRVYRELRRRYPALYRRLLEQYLAEERAKHLAAVRGEAS